MDYSFEFVAKPSILVNFFHFIMPRTIFFTAFLRDFTAFLRDFTAFSRDFTAFLKDKQKEST